mmetsp:Transcript_6725/g.8338  ORF Transcript_6725/g.8338 Transcript_6725/m.8338 type:complete len:338 (-) Transcript_6725:701-1714(-)
MSGLTDALEAAEEGRGAHISTLQHLLKIAHSTQISDQQKAALELSKLVEGTVFPAVSFGPLAHALCRLVPSEQQSVAYHSARAVKTLILDDALRPQAVAVGIPKVLVDALRRWSSDQQCVRELLGALQTLSWDRGAVLLVVDAGLMPLLAELLRNSTSKGTENPDVQLLCTATLANLLSYVDSILLTKDEFVACVSDSLPLILKMIQSREKAQRCYAVAAAANATCHPTLSGKITEIGGLRLLKEVEKHNKANLNLGGTRVAECAETAVLRLEGCKDPRVALRKYRYKWGNKPILELTLDPMRHHKRLQICVVLWVLCTVLLFKPLIFHRGPDSRMK